MLLESIKQNILFILSNASLIDYLAYCVVLLLFVLLLLIAIYICVKSWWQIGFLIVVLDFVAVFYGFYFTHDKLNHYLRPVEISKIYHKHLEYSPSLLIDFNVTNTSKKDYKTCLVTVSFYHSSKEPIRDFANSLHPFNVQFFKIKNLANSNKYTATKVIKNFLAKDFNTTKQAECY